LNKQLVFVYGTLKQGGALHSQLGEDAVLIDAEACLQGYTLYQHRLSPIPVMVQQKDGHVEGELYALDWKNVTHLDKIEGEGHLYLRHKVVMCNGLQAWAYVWGHNVNGMAHLGANYLTGSSNANEGQERESQPVATGEN
jgi:gamma-glutamylcyclotransferase (GGCT)/AIG2-like uncharacterized protein YtfP